MTKTMTKTLKRQRSKTTNIKETVLGRQYTQYYHEVTEHARLTPRAAQGKLKPSDPDLLHPTTQASSDPHKPSSARAMPTP